MSSDELSLAPDYRAWIGDLKTRFRAVQLKAAVSVNTELLRFYWELGTDIVAKQADHAWGSGFIKQLSHDLMREFPEVKGFSTNNLMHIRQWVTFWNADAIGQQAVGQLGQQPDAQLTGNPPSGLVTIPWGHNLAILAKCKAHDQAQFYVQATIEHVWSRTILVHQIESDLWRRQGAAVNNFSAVLPPAESALATQVLKDPYVFDFLSVGAEHGRSTTGHGSPESSSTTKNVRASTPTSRHSWLTKTTRLRTGPNRNGQPSKRSSVATNDCASWPKTSSVTSKIEWQRSTARPWSSA